MTHTQISKNRDTERLAQCQNCGLSFVPWRTKKNQQFCNRQCFYDSMKNQVAVACLNCGAEFQVPPNRILAKVTYCSIACKSTHLKTHKRIDNFGYVWMWTDDGRRIMEHRFVMERQIGRALLPTEEVHHVNEDRADNRPTNLRVMSKSEHTALHKRQQSLPIKSTRETE